MAKGKKSTPNYQPGDWVVTKQYKPPSQDFPDTLNGSVRQVRNVTGNSNDGTLRVHFEDGRSLPIDRIERKATEDEIPRRPRINTVPRR